MCKYYSGGYCRNESSCPFVHDASVPSTPCKFFVAGNCKHGDKCAYYHDGAKETLEESREKEEARLKNMVPPEAPDDAPICKYDPNCYRLNPDHLREYRHPSRDELPPPRNPIPGSKSAYDWAAIKAALPTDRTPEAAEQRKALMKMMDYNGNGMVSLAEIDKCIIENLGMGDVFPKKVLLRAFFAANAIAPPIGSLADEMVTQSEVRFLCCALRRYLQCFEVFDRIDSAVERDGRITDEEAEKSVGFLQELGLPQHAIDEFIARTKEPPMRVMASAVAAKNRMILFQEFCDDFALKYSLNEQENDGFGRMFLGERPVKRWGEY